MGRIIITGGTGLIGRALASDLAADGNEVIILSRRPGRSGQLFQQARVVQWDGKSASGWGTFASGATAIVNLAGESIAPLPWTAERKRRILHTRVAAGHAVVDAVKSVEKKPSVVIQGSAVGYYGLQGDTFLTETSPPGNDYLACVAQDWEASTAEVETMGVRRAVIRTGLVLSRDGGVLPLMALPYRFFLGGKLGHGRQYVSWIHIADHVRAVRFLIDTSSAQGPFNLAGPNPVTSTELSRALGRVLHRPSLFPAPGWALRLVFGDMAKLMLLGGQRVLPQRLQALGLQFKYPEIDTALQDLYRS